MTHLTRMGLTLLLAAGLIACSVPHPPAWTNDPAPLYPPAAYLTGVGAADSRAAAEDRARAEIAKIFQVDIHSRLTSAEGAFHSRVDALVSDEYRQSVRAELVASTDRTLRGVRIAQVWADPRGGDHFALAILDRLAAARPLRSELNELDLAVAEQVARVEQTASPTRRLGFYLAALRALERRQVLAGDLQILQPGGYLAAAPHSAANLAARADRTAAEIGLGIELAGDRDGIVEGALIRALASVGLRLATAPARNLTVRGTVDAEHYTTGDPWQWTVASAQVELLDGREQTPLDSLRTTVREGARQPQRSDIQAREKLGEQLAAGLLETIGRLDQPPTR